MSRTALVAILIALVLGIGALVLQFVLPSGGKADDATLRTLKDQVKELRASSVHGVAYINMDDAKTVLTDTVKDWQDKRDEKMKEIAELKQQYLASAIAKEEYETRGTQLQTELLQAQLNIYTAMINKMIASDRFANIRPQLEQLREQAQPIIDEMKSLVATVRVGVIAPQEFQTRLGEIQTALVQLDQNVMRALATKMVEAATELAQKQGYDLVLKSNDVVVYANTVTITDITELVKRELATYL
jgi:Skp family chaperone for outer membrane proteins